ncbi:hypothetical protein H9L39_17711, partial [Fusarium oxysporum f. sp. albedinis]
GSHLTTTSTVTASCTTAVPGAYGYVPFDPSTCNFNYHFYPSFTGNLAFATIFGLSTLVHLIEAIAFKKQMTPKIPLLTVELGVNAFVYMTVARMVHFGFADKQIWNIKATKLTILFVWIDVVCFLVQAGGGGMLSIKDEPNIARIGTKEIYPFALDALPMSLALTMLNAMHPGFVLRGTVREFPSLSRAETTAIQRQKKGGTPTIKGY